MDPKKIAAEKAVGYIRGGMIVGLGTGSTALFAIEAIGKMINQGLSIKAVASSVASEQKAKDAGITISSFDQFEKIDLYIDGADEVDASLNLLKGGGGALLREKILAFNSREFIVIVDSSKMMDTLGHFPLPVELITFGYQLTVRALEKLGCTANIRQANKKNYLTDNGNLIADCDFNKITEPGKLDHSIKLIPGVVENGLFLKSMVSKVIVGYEDGSVKLIGN